MPLCSKPCISPSWPLSLDSQYVAHKTDLVSKAEAGLDKNLKDDHREKKETSEAGQRPEKGILLLISPLKDQIYNHQRYPHLPSSFVTEVGATGPGLTLLVIEVPSIPFSQDAIALL